MGKCRTVHNGLPWIGWAEVKLSAVYLDIFMNNATQGRKEDLQGNIYAKQICVGHFHLQSLLCCNLW